MLIVSEYIEGFYITTTKNTWEINRHIKDYFALIRKSLIYYKITKSCIL